MEALNQVHCYRNSECNAPSDVTWDVGGGYVAANVDVLFSPDGGGSFPAVLAANTPNDGAETVTDPASLAADARLRINALGNVFFALSDQIAVQDTLPPVLSRPADVIVYATGFDAISGPILAIGIHGREGRSLRDKWAEGPRCYLGLMVEGFPNLFTITGPGSPSVLSNVIKSIEQHVDFIADCLSTLRERGQHLIEPTKEAEEAWLRHVDEIADQTVFKSCNSWYLGSNIPGKPRVFTAYVGFPEYTAELEDIVEDDYRGFVTCKRSCIQITRAGCQAPCFPLARTRVES